MDLSPGKSACILAVVVGCFALLWPSIFYPMLKGSIFPSKDYINEYHRQEQSRYLRPNAMHPALRDYGRPISQPHSAPPPSRERRSVPPPVIAAKKPPIPGLRPPMSGGGHVPSHKENGPMGILMPLYTVGIVIFFVYTITKLLCKKQDGNTRCKHDPGFRRPVLQKNAKEPKQNTKIKSKGGISPDTSKLVVSAISSLLHEVNHDIMKREMKKELQEIQPAEAASPNENNSEKPLINEVEEEQLEEKCEETQVITENGRSKHESQEPDLIHDTEGAEGQSQMHSSVKSTNESSIPKKNHKEIVDDEITMPTNEPDSKMLITDASTTKILEESSVTLQSQDTNDEIINDSTKEDVENGTKKTKGAMDDESKENVVENYEEESSEHDSSENDDIPSTEL